MTTAVTILPLAAVLIASATLPRCRTSENAQARPVAEHVALTSGTDAGGDNEGTAEDAEEARWMQEAAKMRRGEPADMDLDGVPDFFSEPLPGGATRKWCDQNGNGKREWVAEIDAAGNEREEFDSNEDGIPEEVRVRTLGPPEQLVTTEDTNWDGRLDQRTTITFSTTNRRVVVETDPDGDGIFTVVSDDTLPPYVALRASNGSGRAPMTLDAGH